MWNDDYRCPTCGAPLPVKNRFVRVVACDFCANVSVLVDDTLTASGCVAALTPMPSMFYLDARGTLKGRLFSAIGRLRYSYGDGQWDEWFLSFENGESGWLQEDAGVFTYFDRTAVTADAPPYRRARAGRTIQIGEQSMTVTEKGSAQIVGVQGQVGFPVVPGEPIMYVDGTAGDKKVSLEYAGYEVELSVGYLVSRDELTVQEEVWS